MPIVLYCLRHVPLRFDWLLGLSLLLMLPAAWGCYQQEQIRSYTVDKVAEIEPAGSKQGESQRMLAAIMLPGGDAWFFKLTGPVAAVDEVEAEVREFVESVTFNRGQPEWKAPEAWQRQPGSQFRYATLEIPQGEQKPLELSVTTLPHAQSDTYVLDNVNRWRGQLSLPPLTLANLAQEVETLNVAGVPTTWVDITGKAGAGGMRPPFMAGPVSDAPVAESLTKEPAATQVPSEQPLGPEPVTSQPLGPQPPPSTIDSGGIAFAKPATWTQKEGSAFRKLAFDVNGKAGTGEVTVIQLAAQAGGLLANVNRWRGQVQLAPFSPEQLEDAVEQVPLGDEQAQLVELIGTDQGILGAMLSQPDKTWFVKFQGDAALAKAERENFEAFLASLKLN
jgi:hypothetical protein